MQQVTQLTNGLAPSTLPIGLSNLIEPCGTKQLNIGVVTDGTAEKIDYKKNLHISVPAEQMGIIHTIDKFLYKEFRQGIFVPGDVYWQVYSLSDLLYGRHDLPYMDKITIKENRYVQKKLGIDFYIADIGCSFDVKANRHYPGGRCEIELYDTYKGYYKYNGFSQAKYIICYMIATEKCFVFNRRFLLNIVNNYDLPEWFKYEANWQIQNACDLKNPNKRHLFFKPWVLSKLFRLMSKGGNPNNIELPRQKIYIP